MNKICKHCDEEELEVIKNQLVLGDITCCGDKNKGKIKRCRQQGHKVYICRGFHKSKFPDVPPIGPIIFKHETP